MPDILNSQPMGASPFLQLLSDAAEVSIEEVPSPENKRAFVVLIKPKELRKPLPPPVEPPGPSRDYLLSNAALLVDNRDFVLARNLYSYLLKQNIRDPQALKGLGLCLYRLGETTSSKKCFRALWEIHKVPEALFWVGMCHISNKDDRVAVETFRQILSPEALPDSLPFELYKELGNCLTRLGEAKLAQEAYQKALALEPTSDVIWVNQGTLEIQQLHFSEAAANFRKAIELNPASAKAYCGLGLIAMEGNSPEDAREAFEKALELDSQNVLALSQLLAVSETPAQLKSLKIYLFRFLESDSKNLEIRFALAAVLFKERNWGACEQALAALLKIDPAHSNAKKLRDELTSHKHRY
jgi:tetratricopeptide (TPR) repeat protein